MIAIDFKQIAPFDVLTEAQRQQLQSQVDVVYLPENTVLSINALQPENRYLLIIFKGRVKWDESGQSLPDLLHAKECVGASVLCNGAEGKLTALEEVLAYRLCGSVFDQICQENPAFLAYWTAGFSEKLNALKLQSQASTLADFMMIHAEDIPLSPILRLDANTGLREASSQLRQAHVTAALVTKDRRDVGIITRNDLLNAFTDYAPEQYPVLNTIATPSIVTIDQREYLFNALLMMTEHNINHLVVQKNQQAIGMLEQKNLLSAFANQSVLIGQQLERAKKIEDLYKINDTITHLIYVLHAKGVKVRFIAELVSALNRALIRKVSQLCASEIIDNQSFALMVLGSEGRQEQILKTDQDNALVFTDTMPDEVMRDWASAIHDALSQLGFPDCPGNIMITNPLWRHTFSDFITNIKQWLYHPSNEGMMHLSILLDADTAVGNTQLTEQLLKETKKLITDNKHFIAHFAKSALQFETPLGVFSQFNTDKHHLLDIKKGGIFTLVHGARVLICEQGLDEKTTHDRLCALGNTRIMEQSFASELVDAFAFMQQLRLNSQLQARNIGEAISNNIAIDRLSHIEKDLLKESLKLVDAFKNILTHHYKLTHLM